MGSFRELFKFFKKVFVVCDIVSAISGIIIVIIAVFNWMLLMCQAYIALFNPLFR